MKKSVTFLFLFGSIAKCCNAQSHMTGQGHGHPEPQTAACLTDGERLRIARQLDENRAYLTAQGLLNEPGTRGGNVLFDFPLAQDPALDWSGAYAISGFVDQDTSEAYSNYYCTDRTYNGHAGTDYYLWPFDDYLMDNEMVWVVAGAPGTIIHKHDGEFDQQCEWQSGVTWNAVYVQHSDGTVAWYGHLKSGTLTAKSVGETVSTGEYLGAVGSSGYSTGPHLHFELRHANGELIDPYFGNCNLTDPSSRWNGQHPYWEMKLNVLLTHDAPPEFGCPLANEDPNMESHFVASDTVYLAAYFKEQSTGEQVHYRIKRPDGTTYDSWTQTMSGDYGSSYWYWSMIIPHSAVAGTWQFEADHDSQTHTREFYVDQSPVGIVGSNGTHPIRIFPNPATARLTLEMSESISLGKLENLVATDMCGRKTTLPVLDQVADNRINLDIGKLSPGVYHVHAYGDGMMQHGMFVKTQ